MGLSSGTRLGPYEIFSLLGSGGMGEVYRARDTRLDRDVAVKVLPAHLASDPLFKQRFEREARTVSSLNHPHICTLYDIGREGETDFLVMEYLEGETLAERLKRAPLPLAELVKIGMQISDALDKAHRKGVVHRDLKPGNIMLTKGGAKLMDFGLAKPTSLGSAAGSASAPLLSAAMTADGVSPGSPLTSAGTLVGTIQYMSPEQIEGKEADARSDIFAFGSTVYEMATGERAFLGKSQLSVASAILEKEPEPISAKQPLVPAALDRVVAQCLAKDPDERFQSAHDVGLELKWVGESAVAPVSSPAAAMGTSPLQRALPWVLAGILLVAGLGLGWWARTRRISVSPNWSAQMMGGPSVAMGPRISPDGHTLAFQAMVDGLTQVAVMDTESGDWTVLTKDRTRGYVTELNWSNDGSEIYFDRQFSVPAGIYTVSRFGGDERLVLDDAMGPEVLPDGSLLVVRLNPERDFQLYHFWPESGRLKALDAFPRTTDLCPPVRVFRDGKDAVFYGRPKEQAKSEASPHLYILDLASGKTRRLAPGIEIPQETAPALFPIAVSSDDQSVLIDLKSGDLHSVTSIPRNGSGPIRTLLTLTQRPWFMDVGKNGDLYLDQGDRPLEALRFAASGGTGESLVGTESPFSVETLQLPDGRVVLDSLNAGHLRLLVAKPGGEAAPFIQTNEETAFPACLIGKDKIAFRLGAPGHAVVAVASIADGRIVQRLNGIPAGDVNGLSASPDGKTLYYSDTQAIWAIPSAGGQPRRIAPGYSVAPDPNGKDLVAMVIDKGGVQLFNLPAEGGAEQPIPLQGSTRIAAIELNPNAIAKDGRVLVSFAAPDKWFYGAGIVDPRTGKLTKIPLDFTGDLLSPGWLPDGRVLSSAWPLKSTLWRFRPAASKEP